MGSSADPVARASSFGSLLEASAPAIDRERRLPEVVVDALWEAGLFGLLLPVDYGGSEVDPMCYVQTIEEIARHDGSTAWCLNQMSVCAMAAAFLEPASAHTVFGPPRGLLAWGMAIPLPNAQVVPGGYEVSGAWDFASGGHHASFIGGHCLIVEADGSSRLTPKGEPVPRTLLFPADVVEWTDIWEVIGLRGTGSDRYSVEKRFVPEELTLNREDFGERRITRPLYRFRTDQMYASGFGFVALGLARGLLDAYVELANEKTPRGFKTTMRMSPLVQSEVAELEARLRALRAYLLSTIEAAWEAAQRDELSLEHRMAIRLAATHTIREARQVAGDAYTAVGASSIFSSNPFERRLRDIHSVSQQLHGRRSHFETVGKYLLGVESETPFL